MVFCVAQHIPRCIPDLIAEVPVAFHSTDIEFDVAPRRSQRVKGVTQCVGAISGNAVWKLFASRLFNFGGQLRLHEMGSTFGDERLELDTVDEINRVQHIALGLGHLLSFPVAHQSMHVHGMEGHLFHEMQRHHDHARDPKEDDVETRHQDGRRVKSGEIIIIVWPAQRGECP